MSTGAIDQVMKHAESAFQLYKKTNPLVRAKFLRSAAANIEALGDTLIQTAMQETNLPDARLKGERGRTVNQLIAFASMLEAGDWVQASIDTANPSRTPVPKPDLRKMLFPVGPVVVFGASNFPFAYSTAGGDTASALAAGCSVVLKAHPAHPKTSTMVAKAIYAAIKESGMPEHTFQEVTDSSLEAGQQLVKHPLTKSVAFTGSFQGGKALFDLAAQREEPIPVFAEMGSINPVVILPDTLRDKQDLPTVAAASALLGVGQFCTNPGLIFIPETSHSASFLQKLSTEFTNAQAGTMLHEGIATAYRKKSDVGLAQPGVKKIAQGAAGNNLQATPFLATVSAEAFAKNHVLREEVFGPYSLIVTYKNEKELSDAVHTISGQLTASVFGSVKECEAYQNVVEALQQRCGRIIFNGMPTGVEVCKSMQHGGPFPSTTDSRFSSVGLDAVYRFVRPVAYQDFPEALLPAELQNKNSLNILRCVNNTWTRDSIN